MTTRQDLIDATKHFLRTDAGLSEEEVEVLQVERLRVQDHRETIRWALDGGERPKFLEPPEKPFKAHVDGWRHHNLDPKTLAVIGGRALPFVSKTELQVRREAELEVERVAGEERERVAREEREREEREKPAEEEPRVRR